MLVTLCIAAVAGLACQRPADCARITYDIPSATMEPTLMVGDRVVCDTRAYKSHPPQNGDIIVFAAPLWACPEPKLFIKRVVGVPGDRLQIKKGKLYRNGKAVVEPYIKGPMEYNWPEGVEKGKGVLVPEGQLVVLGDNRNDSNDSHHWRDPEVWARTGKSVARPFLPVANVRGKVVYRGGPVGRVR